MVMPLGEDTIGLRSTGPGTSRDRWNNPIDGHVDRLVRLCLVTPGRSTEDDAGRGARIAGAHLLAPVADQAGPVHIASDAVVLWPVTSSSLDGDGVLHLQGTPWEVDGDVGDWGDCLEVQLTRSGGA